MKEQFRRIRQKLWLLLLNILRLLARKSLIRTIFPQTIRKIMSERLQLVTEDSMLRSYIAHILSVEGQISLAEAKQLMKLAQQSPPNTVIVEVGTYRGRSAIALALGSRLGNRNKVFTIDPHDEFRGVFGGQFGPEDQAHLYRNLTKAGVGDIVFVISLPSVQAAKAWKEKNISLLFIDGDHRYEAVRADYNAWKHFVIPGGIVAFHDANALGVQQVIAEAVNQQELDTLGKVGSLAYFRKREKHYEKT